MHPISSEQLDKFAVTASALCLVHCLLVPAALTVIPALGATWVADERLHLWLLALVLPSSGLALSLGCRQHRSHAVAGTGLAGLVLLTAAALAAGPLWGGAAERALTVVAATLLAAAHVGNFRLCRQVRCRHEPPAA